MFSNLTVKRISCNDPMTSIKLFVLSFTSIKNYNDFIIKEPIFTLLLDVVRFKGGQVFNDLTSDISETNFSPKPICPVYTGWLVII